MNTKLAFSALAVAVGFAATPVLAQSSGQMDHSQPGMSTMALEKGEKMQGMGGCPCCQKMAMNSHKSGEQKDAPQPK